MNFRELSLKAKLTLFTLSVFLVGVWTLAWYATSILRQEMEHQVGEQEFSTTALLAANIDESLEERLNSLELIARAISPAMMERPAELQHFLDHHPVIMKMFNHGIFVTGRDGTAIADSPHLSGRIGQNYGDRDYLLTALRENRAGIGSPVIGKVLKKPLFSMAAPIRDANGAVLGVLVGAIDLGKPSFLDKVAGGKIGKTGGYLLVSPRQRLAIVASDQYFTLKTLPAPGVNPLFDRYLAGFEGYGQVVDSRGVAVYSAAKKIPIAGWILIGRMPASEALAPIGAMQRHLLLGTLVFTLAAGCFFWLVTWRLLKHQLSPMISATRLIDSISDPARPFQPLPVRSEDEIGQLIDSFNRLLEMMRQREASREEALRLLQKITSRIPGVVFQLRLRPDGRFCMPFASAGLEELYRIAPAAVRDDAAAIFAVLHPDDLAEHLASIAASAKDLRPWKHEYRLRFAGGEVFWLMGAAIAEREADGAVLWHGCFFDITDRKRFENELDQYRLHLEDLVKERTSALLVAKEAAEASSRTKSTFLANMSHELRTPMNAIMGMTGIALRHVDDPKLADQLRKIDHASRHLLAVINDILDISKIEAGHLVLEQKDFVLGEIFENLTSMIGHKAREKGLKLCIQLPTQCCRVALQGDPLRLGQILLNYAANAVKFTEEGSISVRIVVLDDSPDDLALRFEVADTGIGISADQQQRLFNAFEQADSSMTRKYGGTGLGLAINKRLAHLMGGEVGVASAAGEGSTFWFSVRLKKVREARKVPPTVRDDSTEARLRAAFAGTRVLLAEDEPLNQEVALALLEEVGLKVDLAKDGQQALALARDNSYALILMDMQMPHLNGLEATRAIRALPAHAETPIVAMTANAFEEDRQRCLEAGMNDHVGKPVDPERLFQTVLRWLSLQHA